MNPLVFILFTLLIASSQTAVMEITLNNLRNVLTTYQQLHILFHNPQCLHFRKYVQNFLKIDSNHKLGLVDCLRQIQLCNDYKFVQFPTLAIFGLNNSVQIIDQQQFLVNNTLKNGTEDQVMVNKFVQYLQADPSYVVVVFQHYGLPTINTQRLSDKDQRIFYLQPYSSQNPSNFTKLINSFVHNQQGCWIFKKSSTNQLQKYYCDSGYNKTITQKFINLFKSNKLKRYQFSEEEHITKDNSVRQFKANDLHNILQRLTKSGYEMCTLIYFSSSHCQACQQSDTQNVKSVLNMLQIQRQIQFGRFNIDKNQIPQKLKTIGLKRVPQLIYVCNKKVKVFGEIFFLQNLKRFLEKSHIGISQQVQQPKPSNQPQNQAQNNVAQDQNL